MTCMSIHCQSLGIKVLLNDSMVKKNTFQTTHIKWAVSVSFPDVICAPLNRTQMCSAFLSELLHVWSTTHLSELHSWNSTHSTSMTAGSLHMAQQLRSRKLSSFSSLLVCCPEIDWLYRPATFTHCRLGERRTNWVWECHVDGPCTTWMWMAL